MSTPNKPTDPDELFDQQWGAAARAAPAATAARKESLRQVRHVSNWSLAALLVGVGATSAALAHAVPSYSHSTVSTGSPSVGSSVSASSASGRAPTVSGPVATTSGSQVVSGGGGSAPGQRSTVPGAPAGTGWTWADS